jgi:nucleoside-diphosphate-sugar epimerase
MMGLLKSRGIPVKAITREVWNLAEWKSFDELDLIFGSVSAVFHFGAQIPNNYNDNDNWQTQQIFDTNIRSCLNLAEWAKLRNVAIIFLSSAVVYKNPHAIKIRETDPKVVNGIGGFYGYSKILAEGIFSYLSESGLKCIVLRPSSLYGYGLPSNKLIQNYINIASSGGLIKITGSRNKINFIHAYDVANAALQAYINKAWGIFNISSKEKNTILEVAEIAVCISGSGSMVVTDDNKNDTSFTRFDLDSNLANKSFGFKTKIDLKEGMMLMKNKMITPC